MTTVATAKPGEWRRLFGRGDRLRAEANAIDRYAAEQLREGNTRRAKEAVELAEELRLTSRKLIVWFNGHHLKELDEKNAKE